MSKFCMGCMEQYEDEYEICPYCGFVEGTQQDQPLHMEMGSILNSRFIVGKSIGFGGFGVTYIGWDALLEHKVAIKEYLPSEFSTRMPGVTQVTVYNGEKKEQFHSGLTKFVEEAKKLAKFNNTDGIVKIYDSFEENNTAYIVMEYLEGETLASRLERHKKIAPDEAIAMLIPVMKSLQIVHEKGIIHRDIAPDNLFITKDNSVKLIDFGAARAMTTTHSRNLTVLVKHGYSPEEQYRTDSKQGGYTDVYAMSATLYKMITGVTPPDAMKRYATVQNKKKDLLEPVSKYCKEITQNQETAILNAMNIQPKDRTASMAAFMKELQSDEPVIPIIPTVRKKQKFGWPIWAKIAIPGVAMLLLLFSVLLATGVIQFGNDLNTEITIGDGMTRVPSIVNNTMKDAEVRLEEATLLYVIAGKEYSSLIPADYVLSQDIAGGSILIENSIIYINVSGGAEMVSMPDLLNKEYEDAVVLLEEVGLVASKVEEYSNSIEEGYVISQSEKVDTEVALGSVITLVVSKGEDPDAVIEEKEIEVQDFVGKTYEEVLEIAEELGFKLSISERVYSDKYAMDEIISQKPSKGTKIETGETVEIVVSLGKEEVKVADVQYQKEAEAKKVLEDLGLKVTVRYEESESVASGLVISQSPKADIMVEPESEIELVVSKGAPKFDMPNVVGKSETEAKNTLTAKGLVVSVSYEYSNASSGTVLRQSIAEKTKVTKGTSVTIVVSSGEKMTNVPNVTGQSSANAQSTLKNSGFAVQVNQVYSDTVAEGVVIGQTPSAGTAQKAGTTIVLTVSLGKDSVKAIQVASNPTKTTYTVGETLNTSGLSLRVTRKSGKTETITGGYACTPTTLNTVGTQKITVSYGGATTTFNVTVNNVTISKIAVKTNPSKTTYYVGETLNTNGLTLTATYSNGTTKTISSGFSCNPTSLSKAGTQTITVTYSGKTITFIVSVVEDAIQSIAVATNPSKTSYYVGDTLNTSGLSLKVSYASGKTTTVNSGFTCNPTNLSTIGTQTITVTYSGKTTTFSVDVTEKRSEGLKYELLSDGTYSVSGMGTCSDLDVVIPSTYNGKKVTSIGEYAFQKHSNLSSITIPDNVISIGKGAFDGCSSLSSIEISGSVTSIGSWAFYECSSLSSITIPDNVISIGEYAFWGCSSLSSIIVNSINKYYSSINGILFNKEKNELICYPSEKKDTSYKIPNSVTRIGNGAFWGCSNLRSIENSDNLTSIGWYAFWECSSLSSITIPNSVKSIENWAFSGCSSLSSIIIPDSVTSIGEAAFSGCSSLSSITIPDSVTSIGNSAFGGCSSLKTIYIQVPSKPSGWDEDWNGSDAQVIWNYKNN